MTDIKLPVRYDDAQFFWDAENKMIAQIRGFGYLTGTGGLHLPMQKACEIQDGWGQQIAKAINEHDALTAEVECLRGEVRTWHKKYTDECAEHDRLGHKYIALQGDNERLRGEVANIAFYAKGHEEPNAPCALCLIEGVISGKVALLNLEEQPK